MFIDPVNAWSANSVPRIFTPPYQVFEKPRPQHSGGSGSITSVTIRGNTSPQVNLFSYVHLEDRIPRCHPLRAMRRIVDRALTGLDGAFSVMYATSGRPSIPPERLLRALLLQIVYSIRSEALLIEQLDYNLLFRCSSVWRSTIRCGIPRPSARTATD